MKFVDEATISVRSGNGGNGCLSFKRMKFQPAGGPDGGDGGRGGDVVLVVDPRKTTLLDFQYQTSYVAKQGAAGQGSRKDGKDGESAIIHVPLGTQAYDADSGALLADLDAPEARVVVAKGGRGGWGNLHFKSPSVRAPRKTTPGGEGQALTIRLELKLLADVGLVGFPNAGKSTFINAVSAAKAKVADYPFTTLVPNLGVVRHKGVTFTIADIPGLIEGAHEGVGLGHQFLRHIERTSMLLFLLAADGELPPDEAYQVLARELKLYSAEIAEKKSLAILSKVDILPGESVVEDIGRRFAVIDRDLRAISAITGEGLSPLLDDIVRFVVEQRENPGATR